MKDEHGIPQIDGILRRHMVKIPSEINKAPGISIFGRLIRSMVFSTDVALICNCNANAVIAVYPFTPQPIITRALMSAASIPVFCGVGGGITTGHRVLSLAQDAEFQGAFGVVVNAPTPNELITKLKGVIDIPVIVTVVSPHDDFEGRINAGADILNVSGAGQTAEIVSCIRAKHPEIPIIATGGSKPDTILHTIRAGAHAITYTPPTPAQLLRTIMEDYRNQEKG